MNTTKMKMFRIYSIDKYKANKTSNLIHLFHLAKRLIDKKSHRKTLI